MKLFRSDQLLLCAAFLLIITFFLLYPWPIVAEKSENSYYPKGFLFGSSEKLLENGSSIFVEVHSFDYEENKAEVAMHLNYICTNSSDSECAFFVLQVPFKLSKLEVQTAATHPEVFGGNTTVERISHDLSYVVVQIPKVNQTFDRLEYMRFNFVIENVFLRINHYTLDVSWTFSQSFHPSIEEVKSLKDFDFWWRSQYYNAKEARFDLEKPEYPNSFSEVLPLSDSIGYWDNRTWYRWDLKTRSSSRLSSMSIITETQNSDSLGFYENRVSWSFFFLGLGIPLLISSSYRLYEDPRLKIEIPSKPNYYSGTRTIGFYNILVRNVGKNVAAGCEVKITIKNKKGKKCFVYFAKWASTPEPVEPLPQGGSTPLYHLIPQAQVTNIKARMPQDFTLLVKDDNDKDFYGWNASSYFFGHKNPEYKAGKGTYFAEIEIIGGNLYELFRVEIKNKGVSSKDIALSKPNAKRKRAYW